MRADAPSGSPEPVPARRTRRRWRVPPALVRGEEAFEGAEILDEIAGEPGLVLWQALRDVVLWAAIAPAEREGLFAEGAERGRTAAIAAAGVDRDVERPLGVLAALAGSPERAHGDGVSVACRKISQWADGRGLLATALAYAQAAALAAPGNAEAAYVVGRFARRRAESARAESWFRLAITLGRQSGDWASYVLSFIGLGNLYVQRGNFPAARRFHIRARRAAKRHGLHKLEGMALHDLACIAAEMGDAAEAERFARAALDAYGEEAPRLRALAHDVAVFWMERGEFGRALSVLRALLPHFRDPANRLLILSSSARAAGGAADVGAFEAAWKEGWPLTGQLEAAETAGRSLLAFAQGAAGLGEWERAGEAARRALAVATERGEAKVRFSAESLLDSIPHRQNPGVAQRAGKGQLSEEGDLLASDFVRCLNEIAGAAR